ncbi:hypothetical protein QBC46DRAFT_405352 [Diplogelasinospora grovesii]|uniref:Uncharacterized protein n=1 Tax=Diplogelasinospora grovesii TaxID=303347 RepID=A0AAN6NDQ6_9PEZI|nr:hypothetical protein QBC46DRAFT_405352 [Diplogelasinospora grovesii]
MDVSRSMLRRFLIDPRPPSLPAHTNKMTVQKKGTGIPANGDMSENQSKVKILKFSLVRSIKWTVAHLISAPNVGFCHSSSVALRCNLLDAMQCRSAPEKALDQNIEQNKQSHASSPEVQHSMSTTCDGCNAGVPPLIGALQEKGSSAAPGDASKFACWSVSAASEACKNPSFSIPNSSGRQTRLVREMAVWHCVPVTLRPLDMFRIAS